MCILMTELCPKSRMRLRSAQSPPAESKTWRVTQAVAAMLFEQNNLRDCGAELCCSSSQKIN